MKVRWLYWGLPLLVITVIGVAVASQMPHVHDRIRIYLHPELDLQGKGHQPHQSKIAAGSGGAFGVGLGESMQKLDYFTGGAPIAAILEKSLDLWAFRC